LGHGQALHEYVPGDLIAQVGFGALEGAQDMLGAIDLDDQVEDNVVFSMADRAAGLMGLDVWPIHMERLRHGKGDGWWSITRTKDAARMAQVVALAEERLPLTQMATGPDVRIWGGPLNQEFNALDFVVQELRHFPGLGWPLVRAALQSPVVRARNMGIKALEDWGKQAWPEEARALLEHSHAVEPNEETRTSLGALLQPVEDNPFTTLTEGAEASRQAEA